MDTCVKWGIGYKLAVIGPMRLLDLAGALDRLPAPLADDPRFTRHRGRVAQERRDWQAAVRAYRRAAEINPLLEAALRELFHAGCGATQQQLFEAQIARGGGASRGRRARKRI